MTPAKRNNADELTGCFAACLLLVLLILLTTVLIWGAWNIGLEPAGIVANDIGFWTAFGLALGVLVLRVILGAARSKR